MKKFFTTLLFTATLFGAMAQKANDPVIFEINGKNIYKSEFMKEFLQAVGKDPSAAPTACTYEKRKALEDYVQLYVNYRTKLADAYALGYDTVTSLKQELDTYRKELAAPYLIDNKKNGLLFESENLDALVENMKYLLCFGKLVV